MTNQQMADYAAAMFQLRSVQKGYSVSKPITETGVRYDYILDDGANLKRVQVKYCDMSTSNSQSAIQIHLCSHTGGRTTSKFYTSQEVNIIIAYLPKVGKLVKLERSDFEYKRAVVLRYEKPLNNQRNYNLLDNYVW